MSSLEWAPGVYTPYSDQTTIVKVWELWITGQDRTAWYNLPCASVRKLKDRVWELTLPDTDEVYHYTTLKEAKAMGVALYRMTEE